MSNIVYNHIFIYGDQNQLKTVKTKLLDIGRTKFNFNAIIPCPLDIKSSSIESINKWHREYWGTRQQLKTSLEEGINYLHYKVDTKDTCPYPVLMKLAKLFDYLEFEFVIEYSDSNIPSERIAVTNGLILYEKTAYINGIKVWISANSIEEQRLLEMYKTVNSNKPYIRCTSHTCKGLMFSPGTNIIYDISSESWRIVNSRNHSEVIQNHIKYCSYCGEKLKTCTKMDAVFDFIEHFF